ncbi:MAG TPA: 2OG-Fe dioxygenase family protein [Rhodanobacteraceae bacterium]|nr:2OG-Fe dioxygenase family protein [Rhodanobacteraceae bacterium]
MSSAPVSVEVPLETAIARDGFVLLSGTDMRDMLLRHGSLDDWDTFADSWNRLKRDQYMADHGRYRRRRHAVYAACADQGVVRQAHQPHYQTKSYNPLNGGVERWFEPIEPAIGDGSTMRAVLACCHQAFAAMSPDVPDWHVEVHQFRIEAHAGEAGQPTPEGVHRDGVDYVLVLMIDRTNIASGTTTVYGPDRGELGSFTLTRPLDATWLDDHRVYHGVTAVEPLTPGLPAHRDVLVVTFRDARASRHDPRFVPEGEPAA